VFFLLHHHWFHGILLYRVLSFTPPLISWHPAVPCSSFCTTIDIMASCCIVLFPLHYHCHPQCVFQTPCSVCAYHVCTYFSHTASWRGGGESYTVFTVDTTKKTWLFCGRSQFYESKIRLNFCVWVETNVSPKWNSVFWRSGSLSLLKFSGEIINLHRRQVK